MDFVITQLSTFADNPVVFLLISFIALLFLGEPVVLAVATLSVIGGIVPIPILIVLVLFSAVVAECFWFVMGRTIFARWKHKHNLFLGSFEELEKFTVRLRVHKPLPLLFTTRPFTGLTIFAILLLGKQRLPFRSFLTYSFAVNAFWTPLVVGVGYATGRGYTAVRDIFEEVSNLGVVLALLIVAFLSYRALARYFIERTRA